MHAKHSYLDSKFLPKQLFFLLFLYLLGTEESYEHFRQVKIPQVLYTYEYLYDVTVRHVTGNDQDYLRKIPRVVVQKSALL